MAKASTKNPRVDISDITVAAFNDIKDGDTKVNIKMLGRDDAEWYNSPNFKVKVRAYTQHDKQYHSYFHSLSIDVNVDDFMGTAELKCPYDSDLIAYWEPIRQDVVIYGSNRGPEKILFIGRVRGVKQDGYELVIEFQNYAWKFKQLVTQSYANDNVLNKDAYTILRLMFTALKIDSWVISPAAKKRLKQVGINKDGNLAINGKEIEKMPDLVKRLKAVDPKDSITKDTLNNKLREKYVHNIKDINYTLKYEKPTKVMKKIASQGDYSAGKTVYENPYASPSSSSGGGSGGSGGSGTGGNQTGHVNNGVGGNCYTLDVNRYCPGISNTAVRECMQTMSAYNRGCRNDIASCYSIVTNYAGNNTSNYRGYVSPCLGTLNKNITRKNGRGLCNELKTVADSKATLYQTGRNINNTLTQFGNAVSNYDLGKAVGGTINYLSKGASNTVNYVVNGITNLFKPR